MKFSVFQLSRQGGRPINEDRAGYSYTREAGLFILADGMGGHPEGEVASQLALQTMSGYFQNNAKPKAADPSNFLASGLMAAHHEIIRYASERGMFDTPRTTLVAALAQDDTLYWVHCGDSRMYLVRGGALLERTRDHSYLEAHSNDPDGNEVNNRNILFTCLGATVRPMFDLGGPMHLQPGDKVLLCSDGLWGSVPDEDIVRELGARPVDDAVPLLVDKALQIAGSKSDNVTVVAMEWQTDPTQAGDADFTETELLDEDDFASTIQAEPGADMADIEDMDADAIERSIAEINAAIKRSTTRKH